MGETESIASSHADRGTHHWASRKKMDQIIFGVQKQTEGVEGGVGWGLQAGGTTSLLFGADAVSWPAEQSVLIGPDPQPRLPRGWREYSFSLARAVVKEIVYFYKNPPRHTWSSHMLANGTWKLGQAGWGSSLALTGEPRGGAGKPGPMVVGATLQGRAPRVRPGHLSTWAWPKGRVRYRPVQMPAALQYLTGHDSLRTQWTGLAFCSLPLHVSEPTWPPEAVPPLFPRQVHLLLAWPSQAHGLHCLLSCQAAAKCQPARGTEP